MVRKPATMQSLFPSARKHGREPSYPPAPPPPPKKREREKNSRTRDRRNVGRNLHKLEGSKREADGQDLEQGDHSRPLSEPSAKERAY
jgi:hypothetical protein